MNTATIARPFFTVPPECMGWTPDDWTSVYSASPYAASVMAATNDDGLLPISSIFQILTDHSISPSAYADELEAAQANGLPCLPITHAGQLLTWLGW